MTVVVSDSFFERTVANLRSAWRDIARWTRPEGVAVRPDLPGEDRPTIVRRIEDCLAGRGGEVSARARAADLGRLYLGLSLRGRLHFLEILARQFGVDRTAVDTAIDAYRNAGDDDHAVLNAERRLQDALVSRRARLLTQLTTLPDGFKFLVDLRAELRHQFADDPSLSGLEADLYRMLTAWFDVGLLTLRRIDWNSPASLLEKLVAYEAVHEIQSWEDLKNRLGPDRRCYAFFHPRMPEEPLIFIQVALTNGLADSVQALLDASAPDSDPGAADTAIFYSISNAQAGLRGISLGNFLIKRVVDDLSHELPNLKTFATLSPIPRFRWWLVTSLADGAHKLLTAAEHDLIRSVSGGHGAKGGLKRLLEDPNWLRSEPVARALRKPLTRLCARYLMQEKQADGMPIDPVARFHLTNGAQIERLNWLADTSANGIRQSAGLMVNYLYRLRDIDRNHEAFAGKGKIIASTAVRGLLGE